MAFFLPKPFRTPYFFFLQLQLPPILPQAIDKLKALLIHNSNSQLALLLLPLLQPSAIQLARFAHHSFSTNLFLSVILSMKI